MNNIFDGMRLYKYTYIYVIASIAVYIIIGAAAIWSAVAKAGLDGAGGAW